MTSQPAAFKFRDDKKASQINAKLGINYMNQRGDLSNARVKLEKALKQDDSNPLAHAGYAQLQERVGNKEVAMQHYERAIELEPLNANHMNAYGVFLCTEGKIEKSLTIFDKSIANSYYKTPEHALNNAGLCLLSAKQLKRAEGYLINALKKNPKYGPALLNLSDLNLRLNKLTVAKAFYTRFQQHSHDSARSLWIGYRIMTKFGKKQEAKRISDDLLRKYPASIEAGKLLAVTMN